jgi:hypothetical protein
MFVGLFAGDRFVAVEARRIGREATTIRGGVSVRIPWR